MIVRTLVCLVISLAASAALAQNPPPPFQIPYRGVLEQGGAPFDGAVSMTFHIYDAPASGSPLWSATITSVQVVDGKFSVSLAVDDLTLFQEHAELYLGAEIGGAPLAGRQRLLAVPYARRCDDGVPSGALMFFVTPICPVGWSPYAPARGRAVVGLPDGSTVEETEGTELSAGEPVEHSHPHAHGVNGGGTTGPSVHGDTPYNSSCGAGQWCAGYTSGGAYEGFLARAVQNVPGVEGVQHDHVLDTTTDEATPVGVGHLPYVALLPCVKD